MKHYILTRYNLGIYSKENPYNHVVKNPDEWLAHRKEIFEKFCVPSIKKQTNQNFTWIIAFDPGTPDKYIMSLGLPENHVVCKSFYQYKNNLYALQPHQFLRQWDPQSDWIITSRFDNDDMYEPDFVEAIQHTFREQQEIIDIDYTVYELATDKHYLSMRQRPNSPFLSLVEPWTDHIMTALGRPHTVMPDVYPAVKLGVYASQIIHDRNVINKVP